MRASIWTLAIVAAGLGLFVALAGSTGRTGGPVQGRAAGQEAVPRPPARPDARVTQVEVVVRRVVPETSTYLMGNELVFVTRDEAAMLKDLRVDGYESFGKADSHSVWITLVNHTDTGYLLSEFDVHQLACAIAYADSDGRAWRTQWTVLDTHAAYDGAFTIPLAPRGRRETVLPVSFMRFDPPEDPQRPGRDLAFPPTLRYRIKLMEVRARPIVDGHLGAPV
ncbi:MAG: hypothetical protein ACIAS6_01820 [Phycisphaerales bacterium JB060]